MDGTANLAFKARGERAEIADLSFISRPWTPPESPLAMPRQSLTEAPADVARPSTSPASVSLRRAALFLATFALAGVATWTPWRLYAVDGFTPLEGMALGLFAILILAISCWFCSALAGFVVLAKGGDRSAPHFARTPERPRVRTALLMPLYNEDPAATLARLASIDASLKALNMSAWFDIFVLSDSTNDAIAAAEREEFRSLRNRAASAVYYRRRTQNTERKAGNIAEWVTRFGGAYAHMIILDADSTMSGATLLRLVDAMERHPDVGLIQTTPVIVGAETLFARASQFGVRLYGRVAAAGLAWWTGSESTYWGHNAIVRVRAFAEAAGLPILKGRKPFGGHVLSHDVVEAALLRRAGWGVHVTPALGGSFEETPPSLVEFMTRDRRWCQGNLQHLGMLNAKGLHPISRLQLVFGCLAYVASPLWLLSLVVGLIIQIQNAAHLPDFWWIVGPDVSALAWLWILPVVLLMGPKLLGLALALSRPRERAAFGGGWTLLRGTLFEMVLSAINAPMMMVSHSRMVFDILNGRDAGWAPQQREGSTMRWRDAFRCHRWEMGAGLAFAAGAALVPDLMLWFAPVVLPLLLSAPIAVLTSRVDLGLRARRAGLMITPEERGLSLEIEPAMEPIRSEVLPSPLSIAAE